MQVLPIQSLINKTSIQEQSHSQIAIDQNNNQVKGQDTDQRRCLHMNLIYHYTESSLRKSESSMIEKVVQKKNCSSCGVFISKINIPAVKESYCEYEIDVSPQENYTMLLEDEIRNSNHQFYSEILSSFSSFQIKRINEMRKPFIARIYDFGDQLKQSNQTVQLACFYFDLIYLKQIQLQFHNLQNKSLNPEEEADNGLFNQGFEFKDSVKGQEFFKSLNLKCQICLLVASKFDELDDFIPMIRDFQKLARYEFNYQTCKLYEDAVLKELDWKLNIITPYHILDSLIAQGVIFQDDKLLGSSYMNSNFEDEGLRQIRKKAEYFCRLSVESGLNFQTSKPSIVALSCVLASRVANQVIPWWNQKLEELTEMSIFTNANLREYLQTLYKIYDPTYNFQIIVPKNPLARSSLQKSMISTRAANTLENTQINGIVLNSETSNSRKLGQNNPFRVLEPNQNLLNDSFIGGQSQMIHQQSLKSFKLEEKSQALSSDHNLYLTCKNDEKSNVLPHLQDEFQQLEEIENSMDDIPANYEIDLTVDEESFILTKKSIDKLPESHIFNRQSHLAFQMSGKQSSMANLQKCNQLSLRDLNQGNNTKAQEKDDKENLARPSMGESVRESMSIANEDVAQSQKQRVQSSRQKAFILPRCPQAAPKLKLKQKNERVQLNKVDRKQALVPSLERIAIVKGYDTNKYKSNCSSQVRSDKNLNSNACSTQKQSHHKSGVKFPSKENGKGIRIKVNNDVSAMSLTQVSQTQALRCSSQIQVLNSTDKDQLNQHIGQIRSSRNSTVHEMSELYESKERPLPNLNFAEDKIEQLRLKYQTQNPIQEKLKGKKQDTNRVQPQMVEGTSMAKGNGKGLSRNANVNQLSSSNIQGTSFATLSQSKLNCNSKKADTRERSLSEKTNYQQNDIHKFKSKLFEILQSEEFKNKIQIPTQDQKLSLNAEYKIARKSNKQSFSLEHVNKDLKKRKLSETQQKMIDIYKNGSQKQIKNSVESRHLTRAKIASIDLCNSALDNLSAISKMQNVQSQKHFNNLQKYEISKVYGSLERNQDEGRPLKSQKAPLNSSKGLQSARESLNPIKERQSLQLISKAQQHISQLNSKRMSDNCQYQPKTKLNQYNQNKVSNKIIHSSVSHEKTKLYMSSQNASEFQVVVHPKQDQQKGRDNLISQRHNQKVQKLKISQAQKIPLSARSFGTANSGGVGSESNQQKSQVKPQEQKAYDKQDFKIFSQRIKSVALVNSPIKQDQPYQILDSCPVLGEAQSQSQLRSSTNMQALDQLRKYCSSNPLNQTQAHLNSKQSLNSYLGRITGNKWQSRESSLGKLQSKKQSIAPISIDQPSSLGPFLTQRASQKEIVPLTTSMSFSKFHKFQSKMPKKDQSYSLIERAIGKKNQTQIKYFETTLGGEIIDNTWDILDEKVATENNLKNLSINSSALHIPPAHLAQAQLISARNIRVSHVKSPSQLMQHSQVSINPQDFPHNNALKNSSNGDNQSKLRLSSTIALTNHLNTSSQAALHPIDQRSSSSNVNQIKQGLYPQRVVKKQDVFVDQQRKNSGITMSSFQNCKMLNCSSTLQNSQASFAERNQETQSVGLVPRLSLVYSQSVLPHTATTQSNLEISMDQKCQYKLPKMQLPASARISSNNYQPNLISQPLSSQHLKTDQLMRVSQQFKNYFGRMIMH